MKRRNPFKPVLVATAIVALVGGYLDPTISTFLPHWPQPARADFSSTPNSSDWETNGLVNDIVLTPTTAYIGGGFTMVQRTAVGGVPVNTSTAQASVSRPQFSGGYVSTAVSDGAGGWYVGGSFTAVNGTTRNYLAHIDADGDLDMTFDPDMDSQVDILLLNGTTLYAGGFFTAAKSTSTPVARNGIAAFDTTGDGTPTSFDPNLGALGTASAFALGGTTLYVGGTFTTVNGATPRTNLAAFNTTTGTATDFDPNVNLQPQALVLNGTTLYAGGQFTTVNGATPRNKLAAFDTSTGTATSFDPDPNSTVFALALSGTTLYAAGSFTSVNVNGTPVARNRIAAFNTATSVATSFDPDANSGVIALLLDGTTLYAGGNFTEVNSGATPATRNKIAAFNTTTSVATSFDPSVDAGPVSAFALSGTTLFIGGNFTVVNRYARNRVFAIDRSTDMITSFDPDLDNTANVLLLDGTTLYVGGAFTTVNGGGARNYLAAFDTTTGDATAFDPDMNGLVLTLLLDGTTLYAGGQFTSVNVNTTPADRNYLAAFNTGTSVVTDFDAGIASALGNSVLALVLDGTTLYAGGQFTTVGGATPRNYLAAFDATTGDVVVGFDPDLNAYSDALLLDGTTLYTGGNFTSVNNNATPAARNYLAAFNTTTGTAASFNPNLDGTVEALVLDGTTLYAGGSFNTVNGATTRNYLAAFDTTTGTATSFDPDFDDIVYGLALDDTTLYVGGIFTIANSSTTPVTRNNLSAFDVSPSAGTPTPLGGGANRPHDPPPPTPTPPPVAPLGIAINNDAANTRSRNVLVTLNALVRPAFVNTLDVLLSNDPAFSTFIPFAYTFSSASANSVSGVDAWTDTVPWDLCFGVPSPCTIGNKVVYARFYVNQPPLFPELTPMPTTDPTAVDAAIHLVQ